MCSAVNTRYLQRNLIFSFQQLSNLSVSECSLLSKGNLFNTSKAAVFELCTGSV